jgi:homoserine O-succinyltransferase/O-acetyltransferase
MPLIVPDDLATRWILEADGVFLLDRAGAERQDIRPLRILVIDPGDGDPAAGAAIDDLLVLLGLTPLQLEVVIGTLPGAKPSASRLSPSRTWDPRWSERFDAVIGADRPHDPGLPETGRWWDEVRDLLDWATEHANAQFLIGWSAAAGLAHRHGIASSSDPAEAPNQRREHRVLRRQSYLLRGIDDEFPMTVRWPRRPPRHFVLDVPGIDLLIASTDGDPYLVRTHDRRTVYLLHHPLAADGAGAAHAALILNNWIHYYLYQPASFPTPILAPR